MVFGMQDGVIRVNAIKDDYRDLSDFFLIPMHDNSNGTVTGLEFSHDHQFLFSCGTDGNLFMYKWNLPTERTPIPEESIEVDFEFEVGRDIDNPNFLSLEQQKQKDDHDMRWKISQAKKDKILNVLTEYKTEFRQILLMNEQLIPSQRLLPDELELDSRVTDDLNLSLKSHLDLIKRKLEYDVEMSILGCRKIKEYFIDCLESFPTVISGLW